MKAETESPTTEDYVIVTNEPGSEIKQFDSKNETLITPLETKELSTPAEQPPPKENLESIVTALRSEKETLEKALEESKKICEEQKKDKDILLARLQTQQTLFDKMRCDHKNAQQNLQKREEEFKHILGSLNKTKNTVIKHELEIKSITHNLKEAEKNKNQAIARKKHCQAKIKKLNKQLKATHGVQQKNIANALSKILDYLDQKEMKQQESLKTIHTLQRQLNLAHQNLSNAKKCARYLSDRLEEVKKWSDHFEKLAIIRQSQIVGLRMDVYEDKAEKEPRQGSILPTVTESTSYAAAVKRGELLFKSRMNLKSSSFDNMDRKIRPV